MAHDTLRALADEFWDTLLAANPTMATLLGDHRFDDQIEDLSEEAEARLRAKWVSLHGRLTAIAPSDLGPPDRVTLGLLLQETADATALIDERVAELQSDHMQGVHVSLVQTIPLLNAPEPEHASRLAERLRQVPRVLAQNLERFLAGAGAGRTPARICIERSISVIDGYLRSPLDGDAFTSLKGPQGWDGEEVWRQELVDIARDAIRPAYQRFRDALSDRLLPIARPDDRAGLWAVEGGAGMYAALVRHHTSLGLAPAQIHAIGMAEVTDKLPSEYSKVGDRLFATADVAAIFGHLRDDPSLRYTTGDEILTDARRAVEAATAAMGDWFGRLPRSPCLTPSRNSLHRALPWRTTSLPQGTCPVPGPTTSTPTTRQRRTATRQPQSRSTRPSPATTSSWPSRPS
jgi:uncharacterized protein (DUF885 family)